VLNGVKSSRKSTVEQLKPKQKNQLKLRNNQKKTGNVLIFLLAGILIEQSGFPVLSLFL
jgi:hypothetical protein